jgi:hypothetical protein
MSTLTIRLPATKHQRLKDFARAREPSTSRADSPIQTSIS